MSAEPDSPARDSIDVEILDDPRIREKLHELIDQRITDVLEGKALDGDPRINQALNQAIARGVEQEMIGGPKLG
jgi:hypothetical protein